MRQSRKIAKKKANYHCGQPEIHLSGDRGRHSLDFSNGQGYLQSPVVRYPREWSEFPGTPASHTSIRNLV